MTKFKTDVWQVKTMMSWHVISKRSKVTVSATSQHSIVVQCCLSLKIQSMGWTQALRFCWYWALGDCCWNGKQTLSHDIQFMSLLKMPSGGLVFLTLCDFCALNRRVLFGRKKLDHFLSLNGATCPLSWLYSFSLSLFYLSFHVINVIFWTVKK